MHHPRHRLIADASPMHRRCIADESDPIYSDPAQEASNVVKAMRYNFGGKAMVCRLCDASLGV
eukprot:1551433-Pyramimonas_sp.AAC.1